MAEAQVVLETRCTMTFVAAYGQITEDACDWTKMAAFMLFTKHRLYSNLHLVIHETFNKFFSNKKLRQCEGTARRVTKVKYRT